MRRMVLVGLACAGAAAAALAPQPAQAWWRPGLWGPRVLVAPAFAPPPPFWVAPSVVWRRARPCCRRPAVVALAPAFPLIVVR